LTRQADWLLSLAKLRARHIAKLASHARDNECDPAIIEILAAIEHEARAILNDEEPKRGLK
jgi:hypothetical protein